MFIIYIFIVSVQNKKGKLNETYVFNPTFRYHNDATTKQK